MQTPQIGHDAAGIASVEVILLKLRFGSLIVQHKYRFRFPTANDARVSATFDLVAALEWLKGVNKEAGPEFADAIGRVWLAAAHCLAP